MADKGMNVCVMFDPGQQLMMVQCGTTKMLPVDSLHLLIADIDGFRLAATSPKPQSPTNTAPQDFTQSMLEPESLWVSIHAGTGRATTAENGWIDSPELSTCMASSREFAQSSKHIGGR
jgi:hypothetical protein